MWRRSKHTRSVLCGTVVSSLLYPLPVAFGAIAKGGRLSLLSAAMWLCRKKPNWEMLRAISCPKLTNYPSLILKIGAEMSQHMISSFVTFNVQMLIQRSELQCGTFLDCFI
ncbi:hypothetical protein L596_010090 [Steinernema carpocapsae]|uniref:Uncharacterized protein n=1 Tax=Steinernema carpocapsae TaxID=34508 RepID=A0A4U5PHA3_STECR|nr:hypothetical protein L596_010090 [Steinernema carpocapsae]